MDFRFYIFGVPEKFDLYKGNAEETQYFQTFYGGSKENTKLIIYRRVNGQVSYSYLRYNLVTSGSRSGAFFGMSVEFDNKYCTDIKGLYRFFDEHVYKNTILQKGILLKKISDVQDAFVVRSFKEVPDEIDRIENFVRENFKNAGFERDMKPLDNSFKLGKNHNLLKICDIKNTNEEIISEMKNYPMLSILECQGTPPPASKHLAPEVIIKMEDDSKSANDFFDSIYLADLIDDDAKKVLDQFLGMMKQNLEKIDKRLPYQESLSELQEETKKIISNIESIEDILNTSKAYQSVTSIREKQKKRDWIFWLIWSVIVFLTMSGFLYWLSSGWQIENIISCISTLVLGLICGLSVWLKQPRKKTMKFFKKVINKIIQKCKNDPISIVGLFIAIGSIFITAFWDVVVQYENPKESVENLYKNDEYEIQWADYAEKTESKDIAFIIDNSKSLNKQSDISADNIKNLWDSIIKTGWVKETDGHKIETTKFAVAKYKLMWLLNKLYKESIRGTYSIYIFSNNTSTSIAFNEKITDATLRKSFKEIQELKAYGETTNFIELFRSLKEHSSEIKPFTSYNECPYVLIFFSDYLHDTNKNSNEQTDRETIIGYIKDLSRKHIFPSLRFFEIDRNPTEITGKNFSVLKLFENNDIISDFRYEFTPIENNNFSVFSKLNTEKPIKFYYSSYLHSNNLKSTLIFNNGNFEFWLERKNNIDDRQEFHIQTYQQYSLLDNKQHISEKLKKNDTVKITMNGHIPFQYPFAELVVKDTDKHIEYHSEIVFVRQLPKFLHWAIPLFFGLLGLYIILLFCPQVNK